MLLEEAEGSGQVAVPENVARFGGLAIDIPGPHGIRVWRSTAALGVAIYGVRQAPAIGDDFRYREAFLRVIDGRDSDQPTPNTPFPEPES